MVLCCPATSSWWLRGGRTPVFVDSDHVQIPCDFEEWHGITHATIATFLFLKGAAHLKCMSCFYILIDNLNSATIKQSCILQPSPIPVFQRRAVKPQTQTIASKPPTTKSNPSPQNFQNPQKNNHLKSQLFKTSKTKICPIHPAAGGLRGRVGHHPGPRAAQRLSDGGLGGGAGRHRSQRRLGQEAGAEKRGSNGSAKVGDGWEIAGNEDFLEGFFVKGVARFFLENFLGVFLGLWGFDSLLLGGILDGKHCGPSPSPNGAVPGWTNKRSKKVICF